MPMHIFNHNYFCGFWIDRFVAVLSSYEKYRQNEIREFLIIYWNFVDTNENSPLENFINLICKKLLIYFSMFIVENR